MKLRLLANENFPGEAVEALRERGHDIRWMRADLPDSKDPVVLGRAQAETRILLTCDKDFGELAFRFGLPARSGIVLFRVAMPSAARFAELAVAALEGRSDWMGHFSVIEEWRIRMTPLPGSKGGNA